MKTTIFIKCIFWGFCTISCFMGCKNNSSTNIVGASTSNSVSKGGSLSRFVINGDYLYVVTNTDLIPFDISDLDNPVKKQTLTIGFNIETIFPFNDYLFIGSADAFLIYDISDPAKPMYVSRYIHTTACDPVIVQGDYAYSTIRSGFTCGFRNDLDVLDVVNIADIRNPVLVSTYPLSNPRGLAIGCNNKLYVCDGENGIHQFDLSTPGKPKYEKFYRQYFSNDIIIQDSLVIVTGDKGIYQFSCQNEDLELLSIIDIAQ